MDAREKTASGQLLYQPGSNPFSLGVEVHLVELLLKSDRLENLLLGFLTETFKGETMPKVMKAAQENADNVDLQTALKKFGSIVSQM